MHLLYSLIALVGFSVSAVAQDRPSAILVLDGSGSMWGQIDGKAKITIAQEVIDELLTTLPEDQALGLTVYGHRRKGDCSDIETLVAPGGSRADISRAVNAIKPKGKTPLSDAVIAAAEALRYAEDKATVILVTDGKETCQRDPCEVGRLLEETGVDFTAHVVGFDIRDSNVQAELQCLAEQTGGTYRSADNAGDLAGALEVVSAPPPAPEPVSVHFVATDGDGGPTIHDDLLWFLNAEDSSAIVNGQLMASFSQDLEPGRYTVSVMRPIDEATAELSFSVGESRKTVTLVLPEFRPPATLQAPDQAVAGSLVDVSWTGPASDGDYITVAEVGSNGTSWIEYSYTRDGNPSSLRMPPVTGDFVLRYVMGDGRKTLAERPIAATPFKVTMNAPEAAGVGETISIDWTGPNYPGDYLAVVNRGTKKWVTYTYTREGNPTKLRMPGEPGEYDLVYTLGQKGHVAARVPLEVAELSFAIDAPASAPAGATIPVGWTGPGYNDDYIATAKVGSDDGAWVTYSYAREGNPVMLQLPTTPGPVEIRYVLGQGRVVSARHTIELEPVTASLSATAEGPIGGKVQVSWQGPGYDGDYIDIASNGSEASAYINYAYTRDGNPIVVDLPGEPGTYELRYIADGNPLTVLARAEIKVTDVSTSLTAPSTVKAGEAVTVTWEGPGNPRDYIAFGDTDRGYITYSYAQDGSPLQVQAPDVPGTYELRYFLHTGDRMLAAVPISVE